jgi:nitric oxide synthase oxygenase domain/subunit
VTIVDKGTVQYASPTCTQAYADKIVAVLKNNIISGVSIDMAEYNGWYIAGLPKSDQQIANEQNYIQNKNNARVRGYVSDANAELSKIYCSSLNPANFYTNMF